MSLHQGLLKESERRKVELSSLMETSAGLQTLVEGSEPQLEDKLCGLNEAWGRVHTWTEDWLSAVLVSAQVLQVRLNTWRVLCGLHFMFSVHGDSPTCFI